MNINNTGRNFNAPLNSKIMLNPANIYARVLGLKTTQFFVSALIFNLFCAFAFSVMGNLIDPNAVKLSWLDHQSTAFHLLQSLLIAPVMETFLFQFLIIEIVFLIVKMKKLKYYLSIFLSATIFGLAHQYASTYILVTFLIGLCLGTTYVVAKIRAKTPPFVIVAICHFAINLIAYLSFTL